MNSIPYIMNASGWTFFVDGRAIKITSDDIRYTDIVDAVMANDEKLFLGFLRKILLLILLIPFLKLLKIMIIFSLLNEMKWCNYYYCFL